MINQQPKRQILLFEAILNNQSKLQRCFIFVCTFLLISAVVFVEKASIASFFFSSLPIGLGFKTSFIAPLMVMSLLALASAAYFGIVCASRIAIPTARKTNESALTELGLKFVFGACFGLLTAILCSLIFVIAEPGLPQSFLQYHQLFGSLDFILILLTAVLLSSVYLWLFMLPLYALVSRLTNTDANNKNTSLAIIALSSLIISLLIAGSVAVVTSTLSINLIIFCMLISAITASSLGLLYWFVGLEASLIANVVYCLLVAYLANLFL